MFNPGTNTLDSSFGLAPANDSKAKPASDAGQPNSNRFANIFELQASVNKSSTPGAVAIASAKPSGKNLLDQILNAGEKVGEPGLDLTKAAWNALTDGKDNATEVAADDLKALKLQISGAGKDAKKKSNPSGKAQQVATDKTIAADSKTDIKSLLALAEITPNRQLADIVTGRTTPVDLMSGSYEVLDSRLEGGKLVLDVQSLDKQLIKVSIDSKALMQASSGNKLASNGARINAATSQDRIELNNANGREQTQLNELFSKLNIRELEVTEAKPNLRSPMNGSVDKSTVDIKLVAAQGGQEVLIKSKLRKGDLRAEARGKSVSATRRHGVASRIGSRAGISILKSVNATTSGKTRQASGSAQMIATAMAKGESASVENLFGVDRPQNSSSENLYADQTAESMPKSGRATPGRNSAAATRMALPEDVGQNLKPGGKSVTIKIQPENLGSARLKLTMHNEVLTARVTVESFEAKTVVESSLNQLTDQLEKAGIRVNQVHVNISGGDIDSHQFGHRAGWQKTSGTARSRIQDVLETEDSDQAETVVHRAPTYIRSDQVNVFA